MSDEAAKDLQRRISDQRRRHMKERMEALRETGARHGAEYRLLYAECGVIGHIKGQFWNNGIGATWYNCARCGGQIQETVEHYALAEPMTEGGE